MAGIKTHIMDVSSLGIGPENYEPLNPGMGPADVRRPAGGGISTVGD